MPLVPHRVCSTGVLRAVAAGQQLTVPSHKDMPMVKGAVTVPCIWLKVTARRRSLAADTPYQRLQGLGQWALAMCAMWGVFATFPL